MTEVKFDAKNWYDHYHARPDYDLIESQLSAKDGVRWSNTLPADDEGIRLIRRMKIDTNVSTKIDNEERNLKVNIDCDFVFDCIIEKNLSSEDAKEAERALKTAIESGDDVFRVRTMAIGRTDKTPLLDLDHVQISDCDSGEILDSEEVTELIRDFMMNKSSDLGDYVFIEDLVPTIKGERITMVCRVPEELMKSSNSAKQAFHAENWMNYYNAKIDERYFNDTIDDCYEGWPNAKIDVSGDTITTRVESGFSYCIDMFFEDAETGEEIETESDVTADFEYTVVYKVDNDLDDFIEDIEESLNKAIDAGESTFEIIAPISVVEVKNVEVTNVEEHHLDDEIVARISGGESAIVKEIQTSIENDLSEATDARHNGDFIQPPMDKEVRFICTIPTK